MALLNLYQNRRPRRSPFPLPRFPLLSRPEFLCSNWRDSCRLSNCCWGRGSCRLSTCGCGWERDSCRLSNCCGCLCTWLSVDLMSLVRPVLPLLRGSNLLLLSTARPPGSMIRSGRPSGRSNLRSDGRRSGTGMAFRSVLPRSAGLPLLKSRDGCLLLSLFRIGSSMFRPLFSFLLNPTSSLRPFELG